MSVTTWTVSSGALAPTPPAPPQEASETEPEHPEPPPPPPQALQSEIEALARDYAEPVGIAVQDVTDGWTAAFEGEKSFPQQSVSKLWVTLAILDSIDHGAFELETPVVMGHDDHSVFNQPLARRVQVDGPLVTSVRSLIHHAIVNSDNSANDKLVSLVGVARANAVIREKGLKGVKLGADERTLQSAIAGMTWMPEYGLGLNFETARARLPMERRELAMDTYLAAPLDGATPAGIVDALAALKRGELLSPASTAYLLGKMEEVRTGPQRLKAGLPVGWSIAHKTGTGQDLKNFTVGYNDVGLLTAPDGRTYAVAVLIQKTTKSYRERMELMQAVSRAVAQHWEQARSPDGQASAT